MLCTRQNVVSDAVVLRREYECRSQELPGYVRSDMRMSVACFSLQRRSLLISQKARITHLVTEFLTNYICCAHLSICCDMLNKRSQNNWRLLRDICKVPRIHGHVMDDNTGRRTDNGCWCSAHWLPSVALWGLCRLCAVSKRHKWDYIFQTYFINKIPIQK